MCRKHILNNFFLKKIPANICGNVFGGKKGYIFIFNHNDNPY